MNPQFWLALVSIIDRGISAAKALEAVKDAGEKAIREGREPSLEDLKQYALQDDSARDVLEQAVKDAEVQEAAGSG